jgi:hypothetical protein
MPLRVVWFDQRRSPTTTPVRQSKTKPQISRSIPTELSGISGTGGRWKLRETTGQQGNHLTGSYMVDEFQSGLVSLYVLNFLGQ